MDSHLHEMAGPPSGAIRRDRQRLLRRGPRLADDITSIIEYRQGQLHAGSTNKKSWSPSFCPTGRTLLYFADTL